MTSEFVAWKRFLAPYYFFNALALLIYIPIRLNYSSEALAEREQYLNIPLEHELFLLAGASWLINYRKQATIDGVIGLFFMYFKLGVLAALYYLDTTICGWYAVYCADYALAMIFAVFLPYTAVFIIVGKPKYNGPSNITPLNPASVERMIKRGNGDELTKKKISWLVFFYVDWSDHCLQHDPLIADLSLIYGSDTLKFGKVDLNKWPDIATEYNIEISTASWQLPTLILFQNGVEVKRLPYIGEDGKVMRTILDRAGIITVFRLQDLKDGKKVSFGTKKHKK